MPVEFAVNELARLVHHLIREELGDLGVAVPVHRLDGAVDLLGGQLAQAEILHRNSPSDGSCERPEGGGVPAGKGAAGPTRSDPAAPAFAPRPRPRNPAPMP